MAGRVLSGRALITGQGCSREDWQAAHDELYMSKTDSCHESPLDYAEEESPIDAFERECKQDSANSTFSSPDEEEAWAEAENVWILSGRR